MSSTENAERAAFRRTYLIGTVDSGYARRANLTVEVEWDGVRLSLQGTAKRPGAADIDQGGQMQDSIRKLIATGMEEGVVVIDYSPGWDAAGLTRLLDAWDRWHLNDMRPECEHQRALGWRDTAREPRALFHWRLNSDVVVAVRKALSEAEKTLRAGEAAQLAPEVAALAALPYATTTAVEEPPGPLYEPAKDTTYSRATETKTRGWLTEAEHPDGLLSKACPECGYRYGSAWLTEEVPDDVLAYLRAPFQTNEEG